MRKGFLGLSLLVLGGLLFLGVGVLTAADPPDDISISNTGYKEDKKGPVKFTHKKHTVDYKVICAECHHVFKDGKNVWKQGDKVQKCNECHKPEAAESEKVMKLQNAYHKNCKDCHKALLEQNKPTGPFKKCNDCHEKG